MRKKAIITIIIFALAAAGFYFIAKTDKIGVKEGGQKTNFSGGTESAEEDARAVGFGAGHTAVVYKSQSCGCCVGYVKELKKNGFDVEVEIVDDMSAVKEKYNIPADKQSCHTIVISGYFIEGHVPMEALKKLLTEKPEIDGIGLPRMPAGTPGMSGQKKSPYEVYQSVDGVFSEFLTI